MATSASKIISVLLPSYTIDEIQNDEVYWKIAFVTNVATYTTPAVTMDYGASTISLNGTATMAIPEGETVSAIRLIYNSGGSDIIMHEETVNEVFTYGGNYIVTDYTITFTTA